MSTRAIVSLLLLPLVISVLARHARAGETFTLEQDTGYRGIWYQIKGKDFIKYSGGMATYPQQIRPMAIYAKAANKTFFAYGGRSKETNELLHMVSYFDHATGAVPRPRILLNKKTGDAHDNPALAIDATGHLWIFSNTHGPEERSFIHRSVEPYAIDRFERVAQTSLSYGQPWYFEGRGFLLIQNSYKDGRAVAFQTSPDGRAWSKPELLAQMKGHYQVSAPSPDGKRLGVMFNYHPKGLDTRTNLYYVETNDFGATWRTAAGDVLTVPLRDVKNAALVHDYESEGLLVYLKDVQYDAAGNPILLYLTSKSHIPGAEAGPHAWRTAHWSGGAWRIRDVTTSDHNYDFGQLYLEADRWRLIAPTDPGPQPFMTGGEIVDWASSDEGATWTRLKTITRNSKLQQTFVRQPINAHPQFYAYWADGDAERESVSNLYFTDKDASAVWRLPAKMAMETEKPAKLSD
ncbi:MAG: BNR-4 repeat-containing protein [Tepidisphaeraceae bacterium]